MSKDACSVENIKNEKTFWIMSQKDTTCHLITYNFVGLVHGAKSDIIAFFKERFEPDLTPAQLIDAEGDIIIPVVAPYSPQLWKDPTCPAHITAHSYGIYILGATYKEAQSAYKLFHLKRGKQPLSDGFPLIPVDVFECKAAKERLAQQDSTRPSELSTPKNLCSPPTCGSCAGASAHYLQRHLEEANLGSVRVDNTDTLLPVLDESRLLVGEIPWNFDAYSTSRLILDRCQAVFDKYGGAPKISLVLQLHVHTEQPSTLEFACFPCSRVSNRILCETQERARREIVVREAELTTFDADALYCARVDCYNLRCSFNSALCYFHCTSKE
jgi:hypothetical protein